MITWDLFGRVGLVRNWGQIGTNVHELVEEFASEFEAGQTLRARHRRSGKGSRGGSHRARQGLRTGDALATFSRNPEVLGTHPLRRILPCCRSRRQLEEEGSWWPSAAKPARTVSPCNRTGRFSSLSLPGGESKTNLSGCGTLLGSGALRD
jgi:predicted DNA-binding WGR domain protein